MLKLFSRYISVGVVNTCIHWAVFACGVYLAGVNQAAANFIAFLVAVSFSFFANAKFTFKAETTPKGYVLYVGFMGIMSLITGKVSDYYHINPLITLIEFSAISLICGFLFSKFVIFKESK
ncbi:GtrA family protein [Yersinia intermedia]|uniref:Bactoprenol-linked glucose translocase n=1 Tax=Yersinia intermedia TaxID=631 RepID=A0A209AA56_YERIN|nr:GtrA family protein [Yersinia intermedia]OVZ89403.1 translocase [Yersinia intermedia]